MRLALLVLAALAGPAHADPQSPLIDQARAGTPACMAPPPADGVYQLPGGERFAVVDGCLGIVGRWRLLDQVQLHNENPAVAVHSWSSGARCGLGGSVRYQRSQVGGVRAVESTYTTCSGGRRTVKPAVDLVAVAPLPAGSTIDRLGASEPTVRAAAVESLARRQADPAVCKALAGAATPRMLGLAREPCLRDAAARAARVAELEYPAAYALIRLHDEPARRKLLPALVRQGARAEAVRLIAKTVDAGAAANIMSEFHVELLTPTTPASRAAALVALGELLAPAHQPAMFLQIALVQRDCTVKAAVLQSFLPYPSLSIRLSYLQGRYIVQELAPLVRDRRCAAAQLAATEILASRLGGGGSPVFDERGNEAAWALLIAGLPADRTKFVWMRLCEDLRHANAADPTYAPSLRRFVRGFLGSKTCPR